MNESFRGGVAVSGLTPTAAEPFYDLPSCQIHLRQP